MDNIDLTNIKRTLNNKHLLESLDLTAFVTDVVNAFAQMRANHKEMTQEHKDVLSLALKQLNAEHDRIVKDVETSQQKSKSDVTDALNKAISTCENMCHEVMAMKPMDGKDGVDGNDGKDGVDGKDGSPDTGEQIVDKINKQEKKIKAKNIEGLDKQIVKNTQHIISSGVNKVVAGTGITISSSQGNGKGDITITASGGAGLGDVVGPASSVDSNIATFDGVTGKLIKDSGAKVSDFITSAVTSIKKTGSTALTGNVTLSEGSNITLTQTGNDISIASTSGGGDMVLASVQSVTGLKTFDKDKLAMKGTSTGKTVVSTANTSATDYTATLPAKDGTIAMTSDITGTNSGTNTGDQTITNSSDATSHTVTLSASGGSVQLVEGSGITLTTTGTGSAGVVTIASTSGAGSLFYPNLTGAKYIRASGTTVGSGYLDVYTCPTAKRAIVKYRVAYNANGATATTFSSIKVSGSYYRLTADQNISTVTAQSATVPTIVLEAGEGISFNSTVADVNIWYGVEEYTDTVAIKTAKILALANGNNTLYTVPASTNTMLQDIALMYSAGGQQPVVRVSNFSGGARNIIMYAVPSGGSAGTTNIVSPSTAYNDTTVVGKDFPATMNSGDFIVINTDSGTAGQFVWVNLVEIPN